MKPLFPWYYRKFMSPDDNVYVLFIMYLSCHEITKAGKSYCFVRCSVMPVMWSLRITQINGAGLPCLANAYFITHAQMKHIYYETRAAGVCVWRQPAVVSPSAEEWQLYLYDVNAACTTVNERTAQTPECCIYTKRLFYQCWQWRKSNAK